MEPSLIGWEWMARPGGCEYISPCGRNGAQPYRLGMGVFGVFALVNTTKPQWSPALSAGNGCGALPAFGSNDRRNGAQPYRLGMELAADVASGYQSCTCLRAL